MICTLSAILLHVLGAASFLSPAETAKVEKDFRAWIENFETCCVTYHLVTQNLYPREGVRPLIEENYTYCYGHGDFFLVMPRDDLEKGEHGTVKAVWHNGTYSCRYDTPVDKARGVNGMVVTDLGVWQYPPYVYAMPHEWFGITTEGKNRFLEALDAGNVYAFEESGFSILSCWIKHSRQHTPFDVYLDKSGTVLQIDMVRRMALASLEQLREFWTDNPLDYGLVMQRFEFWGHTRVNDFLFPLFMRETLYRQKTDAFRKVMDDYTNGLLSDNEYRLKAAQTWPRLEVRLTREVMVEAANLMVNEPLPADTFQLAYGAGALVGNGGSLAVRKIPVWYDRIRNPWLWVLIALVLAGAACGGIFWRRYSA
jgi:hypothetical protein